MTDDITAALGDSLDALDSILDEIEGYIEPLTGALKLAQIDRARKKLKKSVERLQDTRNTVEEGLLTLWEIEEQTSTKVQGVTVYLEHQRWAKPRDGDRERVVKTLESLGMMEFVNFNTQSLSSFVRNADKEDYVVPPELMEVIEVSDVFKIKTRGT